MPYFPYQGHSCYYEEQGEGVPLLFLHGNTGSSNMFYELIPAFAQQYKTVVIDFLGNGKSQRVEHLPADLWFDEAQQAIAFLTYKQYPKSHLLGSSGGALAAINAALERPDLVGKVIADSFEGEHALPSFTGNLVAEREASKRDENARMFYYYMQGEDWERVVDQDTAAIVEHAKTIGRFFHRPLSELKADILLTGTKGDEFLAAMGPDFLEETYGAMLQKIGHGEMFLFPKGGHPAALSNREAFIQLALQFLAQ